MADIYISDVPSVGEDVEKLEPSNFAGGNVNKMVQLLWKTVLQKVKELPYDPAIPKGCILCNSFYMTFLKRKNY